jgi:hypothetical protein
MLGTEYLPVALRSDFFVKKVYVRSFSHGSQSS